MALTHGLFGPVNKGDEIRDLPQARASPEIFFLDCQNIIYQSPAVPLQTS
jgi:hypothetical protein